jgi:hypothetical protein
MMFPNIKSSDITIRNDNIVINSVTTYYDEDIFATEEIVKKIFIIN